MWCEVLVSHRTFGTLRINLLNPHVLECVCKYVFRIFLPGNMHNKKQKTHGDTFNPLKVPAHIFMIFYFLYYARSIFYKILFLSFFLNTLTHISKT